MDEREKKQIGEQVEPGGRAKAPGRLELLQRFINTWNHDLPADWDRLATPQSARVWLCEKQLIAGQAKVSATDAARLRALREAFRSLILAYVTGQRDAVSIRTVRTAAIAGTLIVTIDDDGRTHLQARQTSVDGAVATLMGILHEAQLTGDWARLKGCRQCGYAFFDLSKNRSATWCSMSICGNRSKNRAYYRRVRHPADGG
jgi:predicted RNA-binding Zn ribbon-like protein